MSSLLFLFLRYSMFHPLSFGSHHIPLFLRSSFQKVDFNLTVRRRKRRSKRYRSTTRARNDFIDFIWHFMFYIRLENIFVYTRMRKFQGSFHRKIFRAFTRRSIYRIRFFIGPREKSNTSKDKIGAGILTAVNVSLIWNRIF